jgi:hypothetical protein
VRFWREFYSFFPKPVSVVKVGDGKGFVRWADVGGGNLWSQSFGQISKITISMSSKDSYGADPKSALLKFKLVKITDNQLFLQFLAIDNKAFSPIEQFVWVMPWSWDGSFAVKRNTPVSDGEPDTSALTPSFNTGNSTNIPNVLVPVGGI